MRGIHLGILASAPLTTDQVATCLSRLGLTDLFRSIHSARDLPRGTAAIERFPQALAAAGIDAVRAAYVGRLREELKAAQETGMQAVSFNPERGVSARFSLEQYDQLPDLIGDASRPLRAAG